MGSRAKALERLTAANATSIDGGARRRRGRTPRQRRPHRSWIAASLLLVVLLTIGAAVVALARVDPDRFRGRLVAAIARSTGRTLTLGGPIRLHWALNPTVSLSGVTLANLPGGSRPDMARVERIEAQVALWPLLRHRLDIVRLTLVGPNILLEQVGTRPNWVFNGAGDTAPAHAGSGPATAPLQLLIRHVDVVNGMVTFRFAPHAEVIGLRHLRYDQAARGGPLGLDAVLVYSDFQPFTLRVRASPPSGTATPRIDTRWTTAIDVAAFDATLAARGSMDLVSDYDLTVDARIPKLEALNALLPALHLPPLHGTMLSTRISQGPARGDLPVIGATRLAVATADLGRWLPGLVLQNIHARLPGAGGLASLSGTALRAGRRIAVDGTVGVPKYPDTAVQVPLALRLTTMGSATSPDQATLRGQVRLRRLGFDGLDAQLALRAGRLADYRQDLSPLLPPLTGVTLQGRLAVPGDRSGLALDDVALHAGQADGTGSLRVARGNAPAPPASMSATLHATRLDLDALLPDVAAAPGASERAKVATAGPPTASLFPATPIPWHALRGPALALRAQVDAMTWRHRSWSALSLDARLHDGTIDQARFGLVPPGGGAVLGTMSADASADPATVALDLHAPSIPLAFLAEQVGLPGPVSGNLVLHTTLHARGDTPHALAASLTGPFSLTLAGGTLDDPALIRLASVALDELRITVPAQGETPIGCFGLVGQFASGVGRFPTVALDTGYLRLSGEGEVDLGAETLALKLHPLAHLAGASVAVPVLVDGALTDIHSRLDASGLDKLGLLIDAWFGGDHPHICSDAGLVPASP